MNDAVAQADTTQAPRGRRAGGGREAKRAARSARSSQSVPYITRRIPYYEVLDEEGLATIEHNADTILEETGIDFRDDPEALELFRAAGCDVKASASNFRVAWRARSCRPRPRASSPSTRATRPTTW